MNLYDQLYEKLSTEYELFLDGLKQLPPGKILDAAYEKVFKSDILTCFEEDTFSETQARALLEIDQPLERLYREWMDTDVSYMDMVRDCVDGFLERLIEPETEHEPSEHIVSETTQFSDDDEISPGEKEAMYDQLIERLNKNYADYLNSLEGFGKSEIIDMSGKIHAVSDAYSYMTAWHDFDEHELEFYLQFQNPLEVVATEWRERNIDLKDMGDTLEYLYGNSDDLLQDYPLMSDIDAPVDTNQNRNPPEKPEQTASKKKLTIEEKLEAGKERVKAHDVFNNNKPKTNKKEERT